MKRILLIATVYRVGERIYPIIPKLSEEFTVDVFKTAQMGNKIDWYGDNDLRLIFDDKYKNYLNELINDTSDLNKVTYPDSRYYDLILMDDDRPRNSMKEIYQGANRYDTPVMGHQHGNQDIINSKPNLRETGRVSWDYITVFGKKEKAIGVCVNRFDDDTKQSFMELYDKVDADFDFSKAEDEAYQEDV